jgi:hypothetical protein
MPEWKDWKTKAAREFAEETRKLGNIPMLDSDRESLDNMRAIAKRTLDKFVNLMPEKTLIGKVGDVFLKCRPDLLSNDLSIVIEYKTTTDAHPARWGRTTCFKQGYDVQMSLARKIIRSLNSKIDPRCFLLVQEINEPYACSFIELSCEALDRAETMIDRSISMWYDGIAHGNWPDYASTNGVYELKPPKWEIDYA